MIKLVRNTLGDWGFLYDDKGEKIDWNLFKELVKLQEESGLHCATRLRSRHIKYFREKMKVKLAVQTLSASVADALEYCDKDLNILSFRNSDATVKFCRNMNNIFDILNIRNFLVSTPFKRPLFKGNSEFLRTLIKNSIEYLSSLKGTKGENIMLTGRKTGFLGLIICLSSI